MGSTNEVLFLQELPADATNAEALAWVDRMRRLLDRWDRLPERDRRSMTPELKDQLRIDLRAVEESVRSNMASSAR